MRKSGWAAATGLASLVLLLAACGGSSGTTSASGGGASGAPSSQASGGSPGSSGQAAPSSPGSSASSKGKGGSNPTSRPSPHHTAGPQPSSPVTFPPQGTTFMIVLHTRLGYVMGRAHGNQVVYTYAKDRKGGSPTCTGACASQWPPVTGMPKAGPADRFPGTFGVVKGSGGVEQVTYNGMPLYLYAGAKGFTTPGQGVGGVWHVVPLSASDIVGA
jgi:predicted lipoprotein with Yx(FWY)xxD motif